ncbi:MAG: hypothetical protein KF715_08945 [Candidatus Didemnitutus sp.]|nr:hypothetical protein [Candidatus Didemnitutus sp.]
MRELTWPGVRVPAVAMAQGLARMMTASNAQAGRTGDRAVGRDRPGGLGSFRPPILEAAIRVKIEPIKLG